VHNLLVEVFKQKLIVMRGNGISSREERLFIKYQKGGAAKTSFATPP